MSVSLIRFEVRLPIDQGTDANGQISAQDTATRAFLASLLTLIPNYSSTAIDQTAANGTFSQYNGVYGYITNAQSITALGFLNTLNTALGFNVVCTTNAVTSQP
jgi:hypothetical protein